MINTTDANPFVQAALNLLMDRGNSTPPELVARLAEREPMLSPLNLGAPLRKHCEDSLTTKRP